MQTGCIVFLHRQALAAKGMPDDLRQVLAEAIKVVNYVKSRPLQSKLLENLCEEVGALHKHLLFHTEVRWLSRGNVLSRLFSLRSEMLLFLMDSKHELSHFFSDEKWLIKLAYLADIFSHLNILNSSLQGPETTILYAQDRINAFVRKLTLWNTRIKDEDFENFQLTQEFKEYVSSIGDISIDTSSLSLLISSHLEALIKQFNDYIPVKDTSGSVWITKPFFKKAVQKAELNAGLHDELIYQVISH
uniref:Zinc finger BED domain-containing protein 5 n=1 Tax=Homalodisca liturata TaxID=320908 RepID=A0A1B6HGM3_9HEMI